MKKVLLFLGRLGFELVLHSLAAIIIFLAFLPLAKWYINHKPILGVDFYNMVANAAYYARHPEPRFLGFRPINWSGYPYAYDYPSLHFYLIRPLVLQFGAQKAVLLYTAGALFLFNLTCYFFFWAVSKNKSLSLALAIFSVYSIGIWGPAIWGGNLPYVATMFFLPLSMGFLALYLQAKTRKNLVIAALFVGVSVLGHPQIMVSYLVIFALMLLLLGYFSRIKISIKRKVADFGMFLLIMVLISYVQLQTYLGQNILYLPLRILDRLGSIVKLIASRFAATSAPDYSYAVPSNISADAAAKIAEYNRAQFWRFKTDIHLGLFVFLAAAVILLIIAAILAKKRKRLLEILPFAVFLGFLFLYNFGLSRGFSYFQGGWYRSFWVMPIAFGALVASSWRFFWLSFFERVKNLDNFIVKTVLATAFSAAIILSAYILWSKETPQMFIDKTDTILYREKSGVFPEILNKPVGRREFESLRGKLTPSWLPVDSSQYRLFTADQKVNIWWPTFYEMPLVRGYIDVPVGSGVAGGFFWTDIALASISSRDPLVDDFKTPKDMAKNNALFLIDWYSIGYFEGGHGGSDSFNPPASYLLSDKNIFEKEEEVSLPGYAAVFEPETYGNKIGWTDDISRSLRYFKFKDGLASPIASATNASVIGFAGTYQSYDTFTRVLGMTNTNSKQLIPLWFGPSLEKMPNLENLDIDGLILYGYSDGNSKKGLAKIEKYIKGGGKVFVETGSDVYQTNQKKLPEFFPIEGTKRGEIGITWELNDFSPPVLDDKPWQYSLPTGLKSGSEIVLKTGDTTLMVKGTYGGGEVLWSGANLFYHTNVYKNLRESEFIRSLIVQWLSFEQKQPVSQAQFINNRKVKIFTQDARGVLLRQELHDVWQAKVNGELTKIYPTGPTYPGFMYVFIPPKFAGQSIELEFNYKGDYWTLFYTFLQILTIVFVIDYLFGARMTNTVLSPFKRKMEGGVKNWWEREDE